MQILPGSGLLCRFLFFENFLKLFVVVAQGNAMGGQGMVVKAWPRRSGRAAIQRVHVNTSFTTLKFACG